MSGASQFLSAIIFNVCWLGERHLQVQEPHPDMGYHTCFSCFHIYFLIPLVNDQTPWLRFAVFEKMVQNSGDAEALGLDRDVTCSTCQRVIGLSYCGWDL